MIVSRAPTRARAVSRLLGRGVELSWANPPVSAFEGGFLLGTRVVRRERTFPLDPADGDLVYPETEPVIDRFTDTGLTPLTRYYYTVFAYDGAGFHSGEGSRASALATDDHGLAERLYRLLPAVHQREDRPLRPDEVHALDPRVQEGLRILPPDLRGTGQLRRFLVAATAPLALMRTTAEALRQLHDIDRVPPEYLSLLAAFLDWRTDRTLPVYSQRNEVRAAPQLYRSVGSIPNLRSIVTRYTGWQIRIAEYAQHINRSNNPPQQNLFALREAAAGWLPASDAADLLGFAPPNTGAGHSTVTGTTTGPFALAPGMELTVGTDGAGPVIARFAREDAANLAAATTAEVATALNRQFIDLTATALPGGQLRLDAHGGTLRVEAPGSSLVTLDGAPRGRLSVVPTGASAFRVFHAVADPLGPVEDRAARRAVSGRAFPRPPVPGELGVPVDVRDASPWLPAEPVGQINVKSYRGGRWGDSVPLFPGGEPAAAALPPAGSGLPGRILLAWVERPGTPESQILFSVGVTREPSPAVLTGRTGTPFPIPHGSFLLVRDGGGRARAAQFVRTDFADPDAPGIGDVVNVLNTRLAGLLTASAAPGGALRLTSVATGGDAHLEVDLRNSTAAVALGFGPDTNVATGDWGDRIDWDAPQPLSAVAPGRLADLAATPDDAGAVRLAYARHDGSAWQVRTIRFDGTAWTGDEALTTGPLSSREPSLGRDPDGRIWAVWARQGAVGAAGWSLRQRSRPAAGVWSAETALTTAPAPTSAGDREPGLTVRPGLTPRVFFRTDRNGGADLWSIPIGGTATEVTAGAAGDSWPAPVSVGGSQWLLHRSDRSIGHAAVGRRGAQDTGTLRRYAGSTTVVLTDIDRLRRLRTWDDLVSYTPHRPAGETAADPLREDEVYTRGTIGLYLTQAVSGLLDDNMAERLRAVLRRFLPINVRAVVWLAPRAELEYVYSAAADLTDTYLDKHPDIDYLTVTEGLNTVLLPGWGVLGSALLSTPPPADPEAAGTTADAADLTSLRWRTHHPPLQ
ncbi:phage tail protein [Micromonospora purpureochromogenes]|uniref:phage tail protein n=1 Tax=Micromonospora purpureochromogenes TaxID=47872 RepID=UPI0033E576FA